ncbi:hypothetical protein E0J09_25830 [Rhizobium leguminosarum bv. viciae]|uniref:hypothetical protein n=1 Tax=Rhizobium leguminosarum TaxID=384 RepID=UPI00103D6DB5|nr:hypothetical protein [Rhizobium leguminosarum]TCB22074.1 hypothetical protein E0J09_25830 [Rhizobium leguminosarum bv. viciae]
MENSQHGDDPSQQRHTSGGHWLDLRFPTTGWVCRGIEDAGNEGRLCDVCQGVRIRFAHILSHPDVPQALSAGLGCAEKLVDDPFRAEKRERAFRDDLRIRNDWPRRDWKISRVGNPFINARGYNIAIWNKGGSGFGVTIRLQNKFDGEFVRNDPRLFKTVDDAKVGALEILMDVRKERRDIDV